MARAGRFASASSRRPSPRGALLRTGLQAAGLLLRSHACYEQYSKTNIQQLCCI